MSATSNGVPAKPAVSAANPASYHYTSSTSLLTAASNKPTPPPTLPKYNSGSPSYRLTGLERLANRQRLYDQPDPTVSSRLCTFEGMNLCMFEGRPYNNGSAGPHSEPPYHDIPLPSAR